MIPGRAAQLFTLDLAFECKVQCDGCDADMRTIHGVSQGMQTRVHLKCAYADVIDARLAI